MAPLLIDTVTVVVPPTASVPDAADRLTQDLVAAAVQFREAVPVFVSVYTTLDGVNGPPTTPEELSPVAGSTASVPLPFTVSHTLRVVFPLPLLVFAKLTVSE